MCAGAWGGDELRAHQEVCPHVGEPQESAEVVQRVARCVVRNGLDATLMVHVWTVSGVARDATGLERVNWFDARFGPVAAGLCRESRQSAVTVGAGEAKGWREGLRAALENGVRPAEQVVWAEGEAGVDAGAVSIEAEGLREGVWTMLVIGRDAVPGAKRVGLGQFTRTITAEGKDIAVVFFSETPFNGTEAR